MEKLKIPELKQICRDSGIKNYSKLRKAELIELIQKHRQPRRDLIGAPYRRFSRMKKSPVRKISPKRKEITKEDLERMNLTQLKKIAKDLKLPKYSGLPRNLLLKYIKKMINYSPEEYNFKNLPDLEFAKVDIDLERGYIPDRMWRGNISNEDWVYDIIPAGTILFRGDKNILGFHPPARVYTAAGKGVKKSDIAKRVTVGTAMFYTPDLSVAIRYLPRTTIGFINVFRTKRPLKLLRIDNVSNINKILQESFDLDKDLYLAIRNFYGDFRMSNAPLDVARGPQFIDNKKYFYHKDRTRIVELGNIPFVRNSEFGPDLKFSNWLCDKGFNGYTGGVLDVWGKEKVVCCFAPEVMLCNSLEDLEFLVGYKMNNPTKNANLDNYEIRELDNYNKILNDLGIN